LSHPVTGGQDAGGQTCEGRAPRPGEDQAPGLPTSSVQYALANHVHHPRSLYLREHAITPALDAWLATAFAPHHLTDTIHALHHSQDDDERQNLAAQQAHQAIAEANTKLARYRAALESGTDPALIAQWTAEVNATKATTHATLRATNGQPRMSEDEIATIVAATTGLISVLSAADPHDKADIYRKLGLRLTYQPAKRTMIAEAQPPATMYETKCPRGDRAHSPTSETECRRRPEPGTGMTSPDRSQRKGRGELMPRTSICSLVSCLRSGTGSSTATRPSEATSDPS